jgi:hypothetical protein
MKTSQLFPFVFALAVFIPFQDGYPQSAREKAPATPAKSTVVVPADTTIPLRRMNTINLRTTRPGQAIYCERNHRSKALPPRARRQARLLRQRLQVQRSVPLRERPREALGKAPESAASPAPPGDLSGSFPAGVKKSSSRLGRVLGFN